MRTDDHPLQPWRRGLSRSLATRVARWSQLVPSELQSRVARGLCGGGDPAVVLKAASVEHHPGDAGRLGPLGDERADLRGGIDVSGGSAGAEVGFDRRRRRQRAAGGIVDDLHREVLVRSEDGQARSLAGARDLFADAVVAPHAGLSLLFRAVAHLPVLAVLMRIQTPSFTSFTSRSSLLCA